MGESEEKMYYSEDIVEDVRSRCDIVDVIGGYVGLKKRGSNYVCCCPFHQEKTPSFYVSGPKQMYKCFGCGEGGNVLTFVMKYENLTFPEALKVLADRAGVKLPERELSDEEKRKLGQRERYYNINKVAAGYYVQMLKKPQGERALKYLRDRGLSDETIHKFALGYSDIQRDDLYRYMRNVVNCSDRDLVNIGLVDINEIGGARDRFFNRVMFPILDISKHCIGFGGRVMGEGEPKYLNTRETPIYDKRRHLFGLCYAKTSRRDGFILGEGYMDVISLHQAGFDNACASLGTSLTEGQAALLKRFRDKVYISYDMDKAGRKAVKRAIGILRRYDFTIKVIDMSPKKDPDEFIKEYGAEAFSERIEKAVSGTEFEMDYEAQSVRLSDPDEKTRFGHAIARLIAGLSDRMERKNYAEFAAKKYDMDFDILYDEVNKLGYIEEMGEKKDNIKPVNTGNKATKKERLEEMKKQPDMLLLTYFVEYPKLIDKLRDVIGPEDFYHDIIKDVAKEVYAQYEAKKSIDPAAILNKFQDADEQSKAAMVVQTTIGEVEDKEYERQVIYDITKKVKLNSIEHRLKNSKDMTVTQGLLGEKGKILMWQLPYLDDL
ncbi:MAG: DNA primase [Lachnospiraceae bacterium]|nr:DNA primase [Lachnospiraceae bacterium]